MATEAQIKANQENAKKSTGPTSESGRQIRRLVFIKRQNKTSA